MNAVATFVNWNSTASHAITPPDAWGSQALRVYLQWAEELLRKRPSVVLDVGAGRAWHLDPALKHPNMRLIGLDIDRDELEYNELLDEKIASDACDSLGVAAGSVDLITASATIEHLRDTKAFLRNARDALKPGGRLIMTFPNKWAPFAIINRCIPEHWARWLLRTLIPWSDGTLGYKAYYDCCTPHAFRSALAENGFVVERDYASYFSSIYFAGLLPVYLISFVIDSLRYLTRASALSSYLVYVARRV
jgi:SAM-dependent methyltransferase